jgi:hypothetical protein
VVKGPIENRPNDLNSLGPSRASFCMKTRLLLFSSTAACALVSGCGVLTINPGDDLQIAVTSPDVQIAQQVGSYDLDFTVTGCTDFTVDVSVSNGERHPVDAKPLGNGRFRATLPIEQLRVSDSYCNYDANRPQNVWGALSATCRQDARVTTSNFRIAYAPAWRSSFRGRGPAEAVFAGASPDRFYTIGSGWLEGVTATRDHGPEAPATTSPSWAPLLVELADKTVRLWSSCPINDCGEFTLAETPTSKTFTPADIVQVFQLEDDRLVFRRNITSPPGGIDLVAEGNEALLLSITAFTTTISRIGAETATVIANLENENDPSKFGLLDGAHVFLTHTADEHLRLRRVDGSLIADVPVPGDGAFVQTSLAPSGDTWVTIRGGRAWLSTLDRSSGTPSATATMLPSTLALDSASGVGVAWTATGIVVHDGTSVELFERTAPFAKRWNVPVQDRSLVNAVGVSDSVVVQTRTGVRIFDAGGHAIGGADPIDPACALDYTPQHLAVVGPDVVALAGREVTYQFKVGPVAMEVSR